MTRLPCWLRGHRWGRIQKGWMYVGSGEGVWCSRTGRPLTKPWQFHACARCGAVRDA